MNNAQGRLEMSENIVQKVIDKIRALKENQDKLIKRYFRFPRDLSNVNKENTGVISMVDFVTLKNEQKRAKTWIIWTPKNKTGKNWANVAKSLNKKKNLDNVEKQKKVLIKSDKTIEPSLMDADQNKSFCQKDNSIVPRKLSTKATTSNALAVP